MSDIIQSDVSRPSALPSANLRPRGSQYRGSQQAALEQNSNEYLDAIEEEWNKKVDVEIDTLVEGMVDLVSLASIADKDKFRVAQEAFQAECRAESMIRASHSLLSIIHSMKLLLLLSDEAQIAKSRDAELRTLHTEKEEAQKKVAALLDELLGTRRAQTDEPPMRDDSMDAT